MDEQTATVQENGVEYAPAVLLAVGEKREVKGAAKDPYKQKRRAQGYYSCTCPSWQHSTGAERTRTCAHLKALLGEKYEEVRTRQARYVTPSAPATQKKRSNDGSSIASAAATAEVSEDADVFPYKPTPSTSNGHKYKRARTTLQGAFNERDNGGPRDLNGAAPLLLAHKWPETRDPTDYWLSEKLDGVRAWWNGERMFARSGRAWNPPKWFIDRLPKDLHLDGELWAKRDAFDTTSGICRAADSEGWKTINFMVFDITNVSLLYEERLRLLKSRLPDGEKSPDEVVRGRFGGLVCVLPALKCTSRAHFDVLMKDITEKGGEGLMLREPQSRYEIGRSTTLYKHKLWYDAEALVVGHEWGQGAHKGRMGAVRVQMENGSVLKVGSGFSHVQRDTFQPGVGAIIRYRFQELSHDGLPRFPIYQGTCPDKTKACDAIVRSTRLRQEAQKKALEQRLTSAATGSSYGL